VTIDMTTDPACSLLHLHGTARDLRSDADGAATVLDSAAAVVSIDLGDRSIVGVTVQPTRWEPALRRLTGRSAGSGFRAAVSECAPVLAASGSPLTQLLDDVPVCLVISGNLTRRSRGTGLFQGNGGRAPLDVCAGWRSDGELAERMRTGGSLPLILGPPERPLGRPDDLLAWHQLGELPPWSMRRARRTDLTPGDDGTLRVQMHFRDSRRLGDETIRTVHEYSLIARLDPDGVISSMEAVPLVLPAPECPQAVASVQRVVGRNVADVRELVSSTFKGTHTCTHLNDVLRSLGAVKPLLRVIRDNAGSG
jgi:hypothetical protein